MGDAEMRGELAVLIEHLKADRRDMAVEGLKQFLAEYPDHEVAMGLLASTYFEIGMLDQAQALYEQVLKVNPENPLARHQLGLLQQARARRS